MFRRTDDAVEPTELAGRVVLLTGGTSGIGRVAALELAARGATVAVTGRDVRRGAATARALRERGETDAGRFLHADFADLASVRDLADRVRERYDHLDGLVHNAGLSAPERTLTDQGNELTFQVNHLAPYLLTHCLADRLAASAPARVVVVASAVHRRGELDLSDLRRVRSYDALDAYAASKLANVLFARELADRLDGTGVTANSLQPGFVPGSRLYRDARLPVRIGVRLASALPLVGGSVEEGARRIVHLTASPERAGVTGEYFEGDSPVEAVAPAPAVRDRSLRAELWRESARLVGVDPELPVPEPAAPGAVAPDGRGT